MVRASYCASCPKWPCVKHEVNMWWLCYIISLCSRTFYSFLSSPMINVVTTPSHVTGVTVWQITFNPNSRVPKIEKWKINWKENKVRKKMKKTKSTFFDLDNGGHATTPLAYPKGHVVASRPICVRHIIMILFFQNLLCSFLWPHDLWSLLWPCHLMWLMWQHDHDITLVLTLSSKEKINWKESKKEILNEETSIQASHV